MSIETTSQESKVDYTSTSNDLKTEFFKDLTVHSIAIITHIAMCIFHAKHTPFASYEISLCAVESVLLIGLFIKMYNHLLSMAAAAEAYLSVSMVPAAFAYHLEACHGVSRLKAYQETYQKNKTCLAFDFLTQKKLRIVLDIIAIAALLTCVPNQLTRMGIMSIKSLVMSA